MKLLRKKGKFKMEQKTISDLVGYLLSIKQQYGDLDISKGFGERVYDFEDYICVVDEDDCIEIN